LESSLLWIFDYPLIYFKKISSKIKLNKTKFLLDLLDLYLKSGQVFSKNSPIQNPYSKVKHKVNGENRLQPSKSVFPQLYSPKNIEKKNSST
jgi:hypothetical protein